MTRSTMINQLPPMTTDQIPAMNDNIDAQSENARLVQDVLNEVEMSKQSAETGYYPQNTGFNPNEENYNNYPTDQGYIGEPGYPVNDDNKDSSFLGVSSSDIKQMIIVFILFCLLNLPFLVDLLGKYLIFSADMNGNTTVLGIVFRAAIVMLLYLPLKKFI